MALRNKAKQLGDSMEKKTVIHWFRKGLRIHDNPALVNAIKFVEKQPKNYILRPIFILDPGILKWMSVGANRFRFLLQSLQQLHQNLIGINSRLYVVRGNPKQVLSRIFEEWNVELITFESDIEPFAVIRDQEVCDLAKKLKVLVIQELSHTIYNPEIILMKNQGKPVITYQKFLNIVSQLKVPEPVPTPTPLTIGLEPVKDSFEEINDNCYDIPTLDELKIDKSKLGPNLYPGGETEGLSRLDHYLSKTGWICSFEKPKTSPNSLEPSTTVLSPYLKFGCLSSRLFYKKLNIILKQNTKHSKPPVSLMGQLMWREFYTACGAVVANFDKMRGNSVCCQIDWDVNKEYLEAWSHGKTGYPFIDAIMRQLRLEGWIHHLARHAVACFLTRGDLWISWEEGQQVFEEFLLDADWALNAGNWMWLSASAFFHQFFRVYSPVTFGKKTDPDGKYIKKYCPELKNYPSGIIYEPWKADLKSQEEYGCIIGETYPKRIVVHEEVYKLNIARMSNAYKLNKKTKEGGIPDEELSGSPQKRKAASSKSQTITKYFKKK